MSNNKQTAVEWLIEELNKSTSLTSFVPECDEDYKREILGIIQQAKEMEKEQIMDAWDNGNDNEIRGGKYRRIIREKYYNEEYGKQ